MMRLPRFQYYAPRDIAEAAQILNSEGSDAMVVAGGTDLIPNMKRKQQMPKTLIALRKIDSLRQLTNGSGLNMGAGLSLTELVRNDKIKSDYAGLWQAAAQVATPHLRNMGTLGGNICLDTRCSYYDQNYEWRKAINYCMKKEGEVCWVSTGSKRCLATSSTDTAPALISLGAKVRLTSADEERELLLADLYQDDGIDYLMRRANEIVTEVILPDSNNWRSTYWKLRRRGSFDFPVLSVAAAASMAKDGSIEQARIVLGAVSSQPLVCEKVDEFLQGKKLSDEVIEEASLLCGKVARPVKNTDFNPAWRKRAIIRIATYALQELRGDDMSEQRLKIARHIL
ncbi:MAG: 4-hydroxybenzoyl-CoA reductase [Gammaproteobacteria bacterium]|jgi:4-hydroxybenzoyl-CoA reductase subunit beta|nr:4-hydroxybenzoyl-CoA reductase [Gammaproteobacteria bacterium]